MSGHLRHLGFCIYTYWLDAEFDFIGDGCSINQAIKFSCIQSN